MTETTPPTRSEQGFTLLEVITSLFVLVIILVATLALFDFSAKITRAQTHVAEMQQSLRIGQYQVVRQLRMAGRGGLLRGPFPDTTAVHVRNNVPDAGNDAFIAVGDATSPKVVPGTDVLTVRGVFSGMIYHINPPGAALTINFDANTPPNPVSGTIRIQDPIPETGVSQDLTPLIDAVDRQDAIVIVSPLGGGLYGVVELDPTTSSTTDPSSIELGFTISGGVRTASYLAISPGGRFPDELRSAAYVGLLEEHRYYLRERYEIDGDDTSPARHRLSQAQFYPGTQTPYDNNASNLSLDIADNIIDFQVALGIDTDFDNVVAEDSPPSTTDEWLYNHPDDDPSADLTKWNGTTQTPRLFFARITTLAQTERRDLRHVDLPIDRIEDRIYNEPATPTTPAEERDRSHRRRVLQSVVDMRNL